MCKTLLSIIYSLDILLCPELTHQMKRVIIRENFFNFISLVSTELLAGERKSYSGSYAHPLD